MIRGVRGLLFLLLLLSVTAPTFGQAEESVVEQAFERGPVRGVLRLSPAEPVIGDVLTLDLEVVSEPAVELLMPEFGEALGRFEIVDFAPSERIDDEGRTVARQTYRLQPKHSGVQSVPPLRVEFVDRRPGRDPAPDGEDAYELLTERLRVDIAPVLAEDAPLELRPAHPDLGPRRGPLGPVWFWALALGVALAIAGPFAWRALAAARARRRQRSAYEVARQALDGLLSGGRPDAARMDAFYVALSQIVRTYLEDRFGLRSPELTTQEFLTEMGRSPDLARSHQQLLREFLTQADLVKFAGHRPDATVVDESIASAERFLEETRDQVLGSQLGAKSAAAEGAA
ncbi:MAG: BatD family protein [bacterium]|nr:BatD family protein [bacterium]